MRFVVLFFGFIATLVTAAVGAMFFVGFATAQKWLDEHRINVFNLLLNSQDEDFSRTGIFLLIGAVYCLVGTLFAFFRCGWQGGLLMMVSAAGPAVLNPITLLATGPQIFTAILSCFVRPLPVMVPVTSEDE